MYNNLMYAVKRRILDEVEDAFNKHVAFSGKVKVYNKFPYKERVQYGVVLRNASASQIRLSADNFMGDLITHVRLATMDNAPGESIEWVREDSRNVTGYVQDEDVSSQVDPTQRLFLTSRRPIVSGPNNSVYADNFRQVEIKINGSPAFAEYVNGEKGVVLLARVPDPGDVVTISYHYLKLSPPGFYFIDFITNESFDVKPLYKIENEEVIERTTGTEVSATLLNTPVLNNSDSIYLRGVNGGNRIQLIRGTDYTITLSSGLITFLIPLLPDFKLYATYVYGTGTSIGTFNFHEYEDVSNAIPGVVISIGRRARQDDRHIIIISKNRESNAKVYGGHWQMALNLSVIAKDPIQCEEMTDHLVSVLWGDKKNILEYEGITMNSVEPTGETEEIYSDVTGDLYYTHSVDMNIQTEWQKFVPYQAKIERFDVDLHQYPTLHEFVVGKNNNITQLEVIPVGNLVVKYPVIGYERVG